MTRCKNLEQGPMGMLQQWQSCLSLTLKIQPWRDRAAAICSLDTTYSIAAGLGQEMSSLSLCLFSAGIQSIMGKFWEKVICWTLLWVFWNVLSAFSEWKYHNLTPEVLFPAFKAEWVIFQQTVSSSKDYCTAELNVLPQETALETLNFLSDFIRLRG